jgi:hypothetical protein
MKNIKILLSIIATSTLFIASCSNEEKKITADTLTSAKFTNNELNDMKASFIVVMKSEEYKQFHNKKDEMITKMDQESFTFKSRQDFVNWISINENLSKTNFSSITEAIELYDKSIDALSALRAKFKMFYDKLLIADTNEFLAICAPEMVHPQLQYSERSCVNSCIDTANAAYHLADITYEYAMNTGDFGMMYYGTIAYQNENNQITQNYISCFGACPV